MINLWTQFPQREKHRLGILVDSTGFEVKFIPKESGTIGNWYPDPSSARIFIDTTEAYFSDRKPSEAKLGEYSQGEIYIWLRSNGALARIQLQRGGEYFTAQVTDDELRNLLSALRVYFHFEKKTGILQRGKDW